MGTNVTMTEVDKAFYDSYRDPATGRLDPRLVGPDGKPRRLSARSAADARFRQEWVKIRRHLQQEKDCAAATGGSAPGTVAVACGPPTKNPAAPAYKPDDWNDGTGGAVQGLTNCYAYAMDSRTGHSPGNTAQPGVAAGAQAGDLSCKALTDAVLADGEKAKADANSEADFMMPAPQCPYQEQHQLAPEDRAGYYLVALVATSNTAKLWDTSTTPITRRGADYHWYRQDDDGYWSHKPGTTMVRRYDSAGSLVTNPQTASRRTVIGTGMIQTKTGLVPYEEVLDHDVFCGYFYVKQGGMPVKP